MQFAAKQKHKFAALGTIWWLEASVTNADFKRLEAIANKFQSDYSRFDSSSNLSNLNTTKHYRHPSQQFIKLVNYGLQAYMRTGGIFNITAGAVLSAQGYGKLHAGKMATNITEVIEANDNEIKIKSDYSIDFGGFGKGFLVDVLFDELCTITTSDIVVNGGGDMRIRFNNQQQVPIMHPRQTNKLYAKITMQSGAIASSSPLYRSWGVTNHLVTERSTSYKGPIDQVTVTASNATDADMLATTLCIADDPIGLAKKLQVECIVAYSDGTFRATKSLPLVVVH